MYSYSSNTVLHGNENNLFVLRVCLNNHPNPITPNPKSVFLNIA